MADGVKTQDVSKPRAVEATVNLHKRLHGLGFKRKARRAVKEVRTFASQLMRTKDTRIDPGLNHFLWNKGVRNVPRRVRVRMERKVKETDEEEDEKLYTVVYHVPVETFSGTQTKDVTKGGDEDEE
eukprot:CAMPEP_0117036562 /NCGR_PEP_ID=MMETSP0472-20121206/25889_1 /TAXON_ID=693140 ORGANISM="Tiarina fusus, Strain LIS" /NCGR_SAMPLE_ID=MMETSP0472 /ASSEMBLY_ACC=CAM_ASM_000603 /LENGTH=125 /DNA_ID=CAMNT_0004746349 /DNA_START=13 /DNA_END=390 /DNA_ORIENTATION=+